MLTTGHSDFHPCWLPDSRTIAFTRNRKVGDGTAHDIYVVDREQNGPARLLARLGDDWTIVQMACSPDGKTILLERFGPLPPEGGRIRLFHSIWKLDVESGEVVELPLEGESFACPAWFPNGSAIVYCAIKGRDMPLEIWKCRPDGSGQECLLPDPRYSPEDLTVSPDGKHVAFVHGPGFGDDETIYMLDIARGKARALTPEKGESWQSPSWGPLPVQPEEGKE
jgi:Tol biopolymer transport system component